MAFPIMGVLGLIPAILDKVIPDPQAAAEAKLKAIELAQRGDLAQLDAELKLALGQMEINKVEASTDMFRGGWRPAVGWTCVSGLAYNFLVVPLLPWLITMFNMTLGYSAVIPPLPPVGTEELMLLLTGMLGLGGLRTVERIKGKA